MAGAIRLRSVVILTMVATGTCRLGVRQGFSMQLIITLNGVRVHWGSSRQPVTALGSAEAEIRELAEAVKCG